VTSRLPFYGLRSIVRQVRLSRGILNGVLGPGSRGFAFGVFLYCAAIVADSWLADLLRDHGPMPRQKRENTRL
jgi:hypothetical protein